MPKHSHLVYKMTERWSKKCDRLFKCNFVVINIKWPISNMSLFLFNKDANPPFLDI